MHLIPSSKIYVANSFIENAGRGVFASQVIKKDEIIEVCPVLLVNELEVPHLRKTEIINYYFSWGDNKNNHKAAICLGFGSLYNHSYTPNATYVKLFDEQIIKFLAIKHIQKDEEITVNYNSGNPDDKTPLWIQSVPDAT